MNTHATTARRPPMTSPARVRGTIRGEPGDRLPAQPMSMMFSAKNAGMAFIDYTKDGRKMAEAQLKLAADFGTDCLLTCSDPAREVIDIAGEGSVDWFTDQGPFVLGAGVVPKRPEVGEEAASIFRFWRTSFFLAEGEISPGVFSGIRIHLKRYGSRGRQARRASWCMP
jgi:hypothetical protein